MLKLFVLPFLHHARQELLNALVAMDELMGSNEINMRIAAMTPAFILLYSIRRGFQVLLYGVFRVSKFILPRSHAGYMGWINYELCLMFSPSLFCMPLYLC